MTPVEKNTFARPRLGTRDGLLTRNNLQLPPIHEIATSSSLPGSLHISPKIPEASFSTAIRNDSNDPFKPTVKPFTAGYYTPVESKPFIAGPTPVEPTLHPMHKIMPTPTAAYYDHQPYQPQYHYYPSPPTAGVQHPANLPSPHLAVYYPQYIPQTQPIARNQFIGPEVINKTNNVCQRCGTTETPEWRRGPGGVKTLCNACGLFHAKLVKRKGAALAAEEVLNNKVCKGKNGRRISIKKKSINNDYLKSGAYTSTITANNTNNSR